MSIQLEDELRTQWTPHEMVVFMFVSRIVDSDNRANFVYAFWYQSICWHFWMHFFSLDKTKELLSSDSMTKLKPPLLCVSCYVFCYIHMMWNSFNIWTTRHFVDLNRLFWLFVQFSLQKKFQNFHSVFVVLKPTLFSQYIFLEMKTSTRRGFTQQKNDRRHHWSWNCSLKRRFQISTWTKNHFGNPKRIGVKISDTRKSSKSISIVV